MHGVCRDAWTLGRGGGTGGRGHADAAPARSSAEWVTEHGGCGSGGGLVYGQCMCVGGYGAAGVAPMLLSPAAVFIVGGEPAG